GVVAGARLFESMFGMSYATALWVGAFATISYVFIGGFLAVSWTDVIQASMMVTALIVAPLMLIYGNGGIHQTIAELSTISNHSNLFRGLTVVQILSLLAWGLGYFGQPHILVRFMAAKSVQTIPNARRISISWMSLCLLGTLAVGFIGPAYFSAEHPRAVFVNANTEMVFIEAAK